MDNFLEILGKIVESFAEVVVYILEIIGIVVILIGAIKAIYFAISDHFFKKQHNIKINLGISLALGLEFKMGAEIIKTVVVRELSELLVLGIIILLRALLAFIIHWEIKNERKDEIALALNEVKKEEESK